jgi:hypothetical protein
MKSYKLGLTLEVKLEVVVEAETEDLALESLERDVFSGDISITTPDNTKLISLESTDFEITEIKSTDSEINESV